MEQHKHYRLAYSAHHGTSFSPDKRANSACLGFDANIAELKKLGVPQAKIDKYESLWVKWMAAKGRCMSTMITGGSGFNTRRNDKMNCQERNAGDAAMDYYNKLVDYAKKEEYYKNNPDARPIMDGDSDALERLQKKLAAHEGAHKTMLAVNKELRSKEPSVNVLAGLLGTEQKAREIMQPDRMGNVGFATYALNNNRANIKRIQDRINQLERAKAAAPQELTVNGVRVVENTDDMRLELYFDGKPSDAMRSVLKGAAFKWTPSKGAWQRQLTNNARHSFKWVVKPAIEKMEDSHEK